MFIKKIKLKNFRNYNDISVDFSPNVNIIYGLNAQGKTNLLESIYYLALTKSHHSFLDNKLIYYGEKNLNVSGIINRNNIDTEYTINLNDSKKRLKIDNNIIKKVGDYISNINIIIFYPDDLEMIKGNPNIRRHYINVELSQISSQYFNVLSEYNKLLKIRNEYLKRYVERIDFDNNYFDIITNHLIDKSIYIYKMRKKYIDKINNHCKKISLKMFNTENFFVRYKTNFDELDFNSANIKNFLFSEYKKNINKERKFKTTLLGPQRDDIEFFLNNNNLKYYGSQGQQRLAVLIFKLAEIEIFNEYKETRPILLLDDVFSELDSDKKNKLLCYIEENDQTIITTTDLNNLDKNLIEKAKLIKVSNGNIEEVI